MFNVMFTELVVQSTAISWTGTTITIWGPNCLDSNPNGLCLFSHMKMTIQS